ncbi:MAG: hypothetical protein V4724_04690 [Pseudomonadota bacterium]
MVKHAIFFILTTLCGASFAQDAFPLKELKFQKFFAQRPGDKTMYCLLGNGFFRTISSREEDVLIPEWLSKHPNATAVPVSIIGDGSKTPIVYIWAVDGKENLNLSLVRKGAFPGNVMFDPVDFELLSRGTPDRNSIEAGVAYARKMNPNLPEPKANPPRRLIPNATYQTFLKDLATAEHSAQGQKNGIWADKFKDLRDE